MGMMVLSIPETNPFRCLCKHREHIRQNNPRASQPLTHSLCSLLLLNCEGSLGIRVARREGSKKVASGVFNAHSTTEKGLSSLGLI